MAKNVFYLIGVMFYNLNHIVSDALVLYLE